MTLSIYRKKMQSAVAQLVKCSTGDQRVVSSRHTAGVVTVLCPSARHFIRCLVLVQTWTGT